MQPAWKNRNSNEQYCMFTHQKRKIINFLLKKKLSATKHSPPSNVYQLKFHRNFLFEYILMDIVKT